MKKIFTLFIIVTVYFTSCDKIEQPFMKENNDVDTTACPVPDFPSFSNPQKKVLLEEFTGHKCPNCPLGGAAAHNLLNTYQNRLAVVAIHAGFYATADNNGHFTANYITAEGEEIANYFSVTLNPIGIVNRKKFNNEFLINLGDWNTAIDNIINEQPEMYIQVISQLSQTDSSYCIHTKVNYLEDLQGNFNLCVFITENDIISPQKTTDVTNYPSGIIEDYEHNHVLRKVLGGTWGKSIATGQVYTDSSFVQSYKLNINSNWNKSNLEIISFVYDVDNEEVIQMERVPLIQ